MSTFDDRQKYYQQTRIRFLVIISVLMLAAAPIFFLIFQARSAAAAGAQDFSIWLDGPAQADPGEIISMTIESDATGLYGGQFDINFDPAIFQVLDADGETDGIQILPGDCPLPEYIQENTVDNIAGNISYVAISLNPTPPCDGGTVASYQLQVLETAGLGSTVLGFEDVLLADINGLPIPATAVNLNLIIGPTSWDYHAYLPAILDD
ncbi:MAG: cohesin domain-containing protein [Candidatus Promineifilaceae bacterium]